jgi:hypothetical protein
LEKKKYANMVNEYEPIAALEQEFRDKIGYEDLDPMGVIDVTGSCTAALKLAKKCPLLALPSSRLNEAYARAETLEGEKRIRKAIQQMKVYSEFWPPEDRRLVEADAQAHRQWRVVTNARPPAGSLRITHHANTSTPTEQEKKAGFANDIVESLKYGRVDMRLIVASRG